MSKSEVKPRLSLTLRIFADYHQFYIQDEQAEPDTPDDWGDQLTKNMIAVDPGIIGVYTVKNMWVPLQIDIFDLQPGNDFVIWDHVAEASLDVSSDQIVIIGCTDYFPDAQRLPLLPGNYRVRVYYGGLNTLSENGLEGEDHYYVAIWPDEYQSPQILKKWSSFIQ